MHPCGMPTTTGTLPFLPGDSFLRNEQKRQFEIHPNAFAAQFLIDKTAGQFLIFNF
jgi:hypothetical protein